MVRVIHGTFVCRELRKKMITHHPSDYSPVINFYLFNDTLFPVLIRPTGHLGTPGKPWYVISTCYTSFLPRRRVRKREKQGALVELPLGWITNLWYNAPWLSLPAWERFRLPFLPANSQSRHHTDTRELIPRERLWLRSGQCYRLHCSVSW